MRLAAFTAGLLLLMSGTGLANLIVNGDFEQSMDVGWTDTVYSMAGDYRYEQSDTFGSGTGQAVKVRKYLAKFASLRQAVPVSNTDLTLTFNAKLNQGSGSSTCWPVAAFFVRYLGAAGNELGATCWYNHSPYADWRDNDTMNLIEVTSFDWNRYELDIANELATNLPGVNAADVAQVMVDAFAFNNGTWSGGWAEVSADNVSLVEDAGVEESSGAVPVRGLAAGPNPVRSATCISYTLPRAGFVDGAVYDGTGRRVVEIARSWQGAGEQSLRWNAAGVKPGVYLVRLSGAARGSVRVVKAD